MLKLHYHPASPYSNKAYAALLLRGDEFEKRVLDLRAGELQADWYLALSPFGKMPALETDEGPIYESTSIVDWLERRRRVLLPEDLEHAARHWDRIGDLYLMDAVNHIWFTPLSEQAEEAAPVAKNAWKQLETALGRHPWLAGDRFTLGDLTCAVATEYLSRLGLQPPPAVVAWKERCLALPALARVFAEATPVLTAMLERRAAQIAAARQA